MLKVEKRRTNLAEQIMLNFNPSILLLLFNLQVGKKVNRIDLNFYWKSGLHKSRCKRLHLGPRHTRYSDRQYELDKKNIFCRNIIVAFKYLSKSIMSFYTNCRWFIDACGKNVQKFIISIYTQKYWMSNIRMYFYLNKGVVWHEP